MTVAELIQQLQTVQPDLPVMINVEHAGLAHPVCVRLVGIRSVRATKDGSFSLDANSPHHECELVACAKWARPRRIS